MDLEKFKEVFQPMKQKSDFSKKRNHSFFPLKKAKTKQK